MTYEYKAQEIRVIDGDTVILRLEKEFRQEIDFGFYIKETITTKKSTEMSFRLKGINTPEMVGATALSGKLARDELIRLLSFTPLRVITYKPDKYGRWLVDIYCTATDGTELLVNDELVKNGFAVVYNP